MNTRQQEQPLGVYENMPLFALDLLARTKAVRINADPPFSPLLTLWLSIIQALGSGLRSACSRHFS